MLRRIYFVIPDTMHARRIVGEIQAAGIKREQIHALAREGVDLAGLPGSTPAQHDDRVWRLDKLFWSADLILFGIAAVGLIAAAAMASVTGGVVALAIMLATFLLGRHFATRVPHVHLSEFQGALAHGEVLLMIDVARQQVREIEQLVSRHHPEASVGGIGWSMPALGT